MPLPIEMEREREPEGLDELLDRIRSAADGDGRVSLDDILEQVGRRSFGPFLLLPGLVILAPVVGDVPGVPTIMGAIVILAAVQILFRRESIWLPRWILRRSVKRSAVRKAVEKLRPAARFADRWMRARLTVLVRPAGVPLIALVCTLVAALTPAMELIPFSANLAGAAISAFGLALIAHDGAIALGAIVLCLSAFTLGAIHFF